ERRLQNQRPAAVPQRQFLDESQQRRLPSLPLLSRGGSEVDIAGVVVPAAAERPAQERRQQGSRTQCLLIFRRQLEAEGHVVDNAGLWQERPEEPRSGRFGRQERVRKETLIK